MWKNDRAHRSAPDRTHGGKHHFNGQDISSLDKKSFNASEKSADRISGSLRFTEPSNDSRRIIAEPMIKHAIHPPKKIGDEVNRLLSIVGLSLADAQKYPHEFSGGSASASR